LGVKTTIWHIYICIFIYVQVYICLYIPEVYIYINKLKKSVRVRFFSYLQLADRGCSKRPLFALKIPLGRLYSWVEGGESCLMTESHAGIPLNEYIIYGYIYIYIYIYICIYTYMFIYVYIYIYIFFWTYFFDHIMHLKTVRSEIISELLLSIYLYRHLWILLYTWINLYTHIYIYTDIHTYKWIPLIDSKEDICY
jgi:hypothetical protein